MNILNKIKHLIEQDGQAIKKADVSVGDVTETFYFRLLTHKEAFDMSSLLVTDGEKSTNGGKDTNTTESVGQYQRVLLEHCLVNEDGSPIMTEDGSPINAEWIGMLPAELVAKLSLACTKVNSMTAAAVEGAEKNS